MRIFICCLSIFFFTFVHISAQTFQLSVANGYGSGSYQAGDTVHLWSKAYDNTQTFSKWIGNTQYLENPNEWHTTLIMPNQNVNVAAVIADMPTYTIHYEQIMGVNNLKNVYYCFPANLKGILYLFHGTGGNAANWINTVEYRSFVNAAIADSFGILVTEAEEITLNTDLNSDGNLRWLTFPMDTLSGIDYLNLQILSDTFVQRGNFTYSTPKFSVGMSNGGAFSAAISHALQYQAGVSYCASSIQPIFNVRNNAFAFRMAKYDDNAEVGATGNYEAWQNDSILNTRGICHDYKIHDKQPIYPQRFARVSGISLATSQAIFSDLVTNNQVDSKHYALHSDSIKKHILANPALYPNIIGLPTSLRLEALSQIAASNAEHKFYSDYNFQTLDFLKNICATTVGINDFSLTNPIFSIYPNPTHTKIYIQFSEPIPSWKVELYSADGKLRLEEENISELNLSKFAEGVYLMKIIAQNRSYLHKIIKQ